jgi:hypothetical protein
MTVKRAVILFAIVEFVVIAVVIVLSLLRKG